MREKKFTPGPWVKDFGGTGGHIKSTGHFECTPTIVHYRHGGMGYEEELDRKYYANMTITKEEQEANANLIAEAPALLYACEFLVNVCETAPPVELIKQISDACIIAKQAIAKAYGE